MDETTQGYDEKDSAFIKEVATVINKYSMENNSNTPDFILAEMLLGFLTVFENIIIKREEWFGEKKDVGKVKNYTKSNNNPKNLPPPNNPMNINEYIEKRNLEFDEKFCYENGILRGGFGLPNGEIKSFNATTIKEVVEMIKKRITELDQDITKTKGQALSDILSDLNLKQ